MLSQYKVGLREVKTYNNHISYDYILCHTLSYSIPHVFNKEDTFTFFRIDTSCISIDKITNKSCVLSSLVNEY